MVAGSLAAVFVSLVLCPTELVKCQIQAKHNMQLNSENQTRKFM